MSGRLRTVCLSLMLAVATGVALVGGGPAQAQASPGFNNAPGYTHIVSRASGKCLDVLTESPLPGFPVDQLTCRNAAAQEWTRVVAATITDHRAGGCHCTFTVYTVRNHNGGNCMEVPDGPVGNGTQVVQETCVAGDTRQWWQLVVVGIVLLPTNPRIGIAVYALRNHGVNMCLDVNNGSGADELPMQVWDCLSNTNQQWLLQ